MAGAILGALHGESVIDQAIASQLNRVNKFDLFAAADTFTETVTDIQDKDSQRDIQKMAARKNLALALSK